MAYPIYKKINIPLFEYISSKKNWKNEFECDFELSEERKELTVKCMLMTDRIYDGCYIRRLARLIRWATYDEVLSNWKTQLDFYHNKNRPKGSPSLENFILNYGKDHGTKLFNEYANGISVRNSSSGVFTKQYYINKGCTESEAKEIISNKSKLGGLVKWSKIPKDKRSEYTKSINPICKEYTGYIGLSDEEIDKNRNKILEKTIHSKESYIKKYGEEIGLAKITDIYDRKMKTQLKNGTGLFTVKKGQASKQSLKLFRPLLTWLHDRGYTKNDIQLGLDGYKGERWIRHTNDDKKYCLYDFTILPINVIIEYHGVAWHPKEDLTWASDINLSRQSAEEKRTYDLFKKNLAESNGHNVLEIWSDEPLDKALYNCKEFIKLYE